MVLDDFGPLAVSCSFGIDFGLHLCLKKGCVRVLFYELSTLPNCIPYALLCSRSTCQTTDRLTYRALDPPIIPVSFFFRVVLPTRFVDPTVSCHWGPKAAYAPTFDPPTTLFPDPRPLHPSFCWPLLFDVYTTPSLVIDAAFLQCFRVVSPSEGPQPPSSSRGSRGQDPTAVPGAELPVLEEVKRIDNPGLQLI